MKFRRFCMAMAMAIAMVGGSTAFAESTVDKLGLGNHEAAPEKIGKIDRDLSIRVRLIREKTGDFAESITKGEVVRVEVAYIGRDGANDRPISLVCSARFIDTKGEMSASSVKSGTPCFDGRLADGYGRFDLLDMPLRFRADEKDPAGTYGVIVKVADSISGKEVTLVPTYRWVGDKK